MVEANKNEIRAIGGPELYDAVQRLIIDWRGQDESRQRALVPQLVRDIVALLEGQTPAAAHDSAEAA